MRTEGTRLRRAVGLVAGGVGLVAVLVAVTTLVGPGGSAVVGLGRSGIVEPADSSNAEPGGPVDAGPAPRVLIIGDSLTVGAAAAGLEDLVQGTLTVKAFGGITTTHGALVLSNTDMSDYDEIVVALGTNDIAEASNTTDMADEMIPRVAAVMAAVGDSLPVVWVNLDSGGSLDVIGVNEVIASAADEHPNLRVADWDSFVSSLTDNDALRKSDGIHYTEAGYRIRARWMADVLR